MSSRALYERAVETVQDGGKASASYLVRSLQISYGLAENLIDQMEGDGIVSPADHLGKREVMPHAWRADQ